MNVNKLPSTLVQWKSISPNNFAVNSVVKLSANVAVTSWGTLWNLSNFIYDSANISAGNVAVKLAVQSNEKSAIQIFSSDPRSIAYLISHCHVLYQSSAVTQCHKGANKKNVGRTFCRCSWKVVNTDPITLGKVAATRTFGFKSSQNIGDTWMHNKLPLLFTGASIPNLGVSPDDRMCTSPKIKMSPELVPSKICVYKKNSVEMLWRVSRKFSFNWNFDAHSIWWGALRFLEFPSFFRFPPNFVVTHLLIFSAGWRWVYMSQEVNDSNRFGKQFIRFGSVRFGVVFGWTF